MNSIENRSFDEERALYGSDGLSVDHCSFDGPADGESALKESRNIRVTDSFFNLRYPMWHVENLVVSGCEMTELCRAALWYSHNIEISDTKMHGIKALRECSNIRISGADIISPEFGWSCHDIEMADTKAESEYFMMRSTGLDFRNVTFSGKYSFQYIENASFSNCVFDTKDAFWHAKRVTVTDSVIKGEYLAWYCEDVSFINCRIIGTQPLCYCKGLKLVDCEMVDADLAFERSEVEAKLTAPVISVKNPLSGRIELPAVGEVIRDDGMFKGEVVVRQ